jgi:hypothetical protein
MKASGLMDTQKERAGQGLSIIKDSIVDLLAQHPEGLTNVEIATVLGLESSRGGHRNFLTWTILGKMMDEGRVRFDKANDNKRGNDRYFST